MDKQRVILLSSTMNLLMEFQLNFREIKMKEIEELTGGNCRNNENNGYVQKADSLTYLNISLKGNC